MGIAKKRPSRNSGRANSSRLLPRRVVISTVRPLAREDRHQLWHHDANAWQVCEPAPVERDDWTAAGGGGRRHDQVVGAARGALPAHVGEQLGVDARDGEVVGLHGKQVEEPLDEPSPRRPPAAASELDAEEQLRGGDRGGRRLVVGGEHGFQPVAALGGDEYGGVEDQPGQWSSTVNRDRAARTSCANDASAG